MDTLLRRNFFTNILRILIMKLMLDRPTVFYLYLLDKGWKLCTIQVIKMVCYLHKEQFGGSNNIETNLGLL